MSGRPPGKGNGNPLEYSPLENPMGRGAKGATDHGVPRVRCDLATKQQQQKASTLRHEGVKITFPTLHGHKIAEGSPEPRSLALNSGVLPTTRQCSSQT